MSEGLVNIIVIQLVPNVLRTTLFIYFPAQFCWAWGFDEVEAEWVKVYSSQLQCL